MRVSKWAVTDDNALEQLTCYMEAENDLVLTGTFVTGGRGGYVVCDVLADVDWNVNYYTAKSTSGLPLELTCDNEEQGFSITGTVTHQQFIQQCRV